MRRLFFGLDVDPDVGAPILRTVRGSLEGSGPVSIYAPEDLHLTLCFLGHVDDSAVKRLVECAREEFRGMAAPELRVGGEASAFPSREEPRALWAQASEAVETSGRLAGLRNRALQVALSNGWRPGAAELSRPFRPHVTVARARAGAVVPSEFWDLGSARAWLPVDVVLFESLGEGDASSERYRVVDAWPLAVRPG